MDERLVLIDLGDDAPSCQLAIAPGGCSRWLARAPYGDGVVEICRNCASYLAQQLSWRAIRGGHRHPEIAS